jgi:hypothetical protein
MTDLTVKLVLNADGSAARAELVRTQSAIGALGPTGTAAAREIDAAAASASRSLATVGTAAARAGAQVEGALAGRTGTALQRVRQNFGQIGFQVGDFVTQVQAGGSAFTAFAQQGGQLAGALAGGLAGLVVQVAAVGAQMLATSNIFGTAAQETTTFASAQDALRKALDGVSTALETSEARTRRLTIEQRQNSVAAIANARVQIERRRAIALATAQGLESEIAAQRQQQGDGSFDFQNFRDGAQATIAQYRNELRLLEGQLQSLAAAERQIFNAPLPSGQPEARPERPRAAGATRSTTVDDPFRALRQSAQSLEQEVRTPLERYNDEQARLNTLLDLGLISQETWQRALARAGEDLAKTQQAASGATTDIGGLEAAFEKLGDEVQGFGRESARALADAFTGVRALDGGIGGLLQRLASGVLEKLIYEQITGPLTQAASVLLRSGLSSLAGAFGFGMSPGSSGTYPIVPVTATPLHTGGIVGTGDGARRVVSQAIFAEAPRLHTGGIIRPNEVPAILERGEGVFTPAQMRALAPAGGGDVIVQVIDQRGAGAPPIETTESRGPDGQRMIRMVVRQEVRRAVADGALDREMQASYGLSRRGAG